MIIMQTFHIIEDQYLFVLIFLLFLKIQLVDKIIFFLIFNDSYQYCKDLYEEKQYFLVMSIYHIFFEISFSWQLLIFISYLVFLINDHSFEFMNIKTQKKIEDNLVLSF